MADNAPQQTQSDAIDLHLLWNTLVRRRWLIAAVFVAAVLLGTILTLGQTKVYDAVCTLIIEVAAPRVFDKDQVQDVVETGAGNYWSYREYSETQYKVITSRAVAERVAARLGLSSNDRYLGLDRVADTAQREAVRRGRDPVLILQAHLKIEPAKESRVVRLRYEDPDPQLAALIANAFADAYVAENLAVRTSTTQNASEWLEGQLGELERKLAESGKTLYEFKREHDIVATSWEDRQGMISQRITAINDALIKTQVRRAELEARNDAIADLRAALDRDRLVQGSPLEAIASTQTLETLKLRYFDAKADCADLDARYLQNHPKVDACNKKVEAARAALRDEVRSTIEEARRELLAVVKSEQNLRALLNQTKSEAFGLNQYERDYLELKRTHDNNQRLYELLLKRLKDTGIAGMLQVSNVRILDRARAAVSPARPRVVQNVMLSVIVGLLLGVAAAFVAEQVDQSITGQEQIEERLKTTFLGIIPRIEPGKEGVVHDLHVYEQPKSGVAECLRAIRTNIFFMVPEKPLRTILVTSSAPQEGKTTVATSLAITMAGSGSRVLLVDADMRRPRMHKVFKVSNEAGLSSLTLGEGDLASLARPTGVPNVYVLPSGPVPPNPSELLHTTAFKKLVAQMAEAYDRVIIDSPPIGAVADAVVMSTHADGTIFVARAGKTARDLARRAIRQLRAVNATLVGAVLNDLNFQDPRYAYYYYSRYGYDGDGRSKAPKSEAAA